MKQILSFQKEFIFRTMIGEITSISLEHTLSFENEFTIRGDFIVSGTYKMTEASQLEESFEHHLPVDITVDEHYDMTNSKIEIDDFYYEIINDEILKVNIDVLLDGIEKEEKVVNILPLEEELVRTSVLKEEPKEIEEKTYGDEMVINPIFNENNNTLKKQEKVVDVKPSVESNNIDSIFSAFRDTDETFSTYSIYIVRENDTIDQIMDRYHITKEELEHYNRLDEMTLGTKLIIPTCIQKNE